MCVGLLQGCQTAASGVWGESVEGETQPSREEGGSGNREATTERNQGRHTHKQHTHEAGRHRKDFDDGGKKEKSKGTNVRWKGSKFVTITEVIWVGINLKIK